MAQARNVARVACARRASTAGHEARSNGATVTAAPTFAPVIAIAPRFAPFHLQRDPLPRRRTAISSITTESVCREPSTRVKSCASTTLPPGTA